MQKPRRKERNLPQSSTTRAKTLRIAMGYKGRGGPLGFANYLNVTTTRWYNVETGFPIGHGMAEILLRKCPGISLDWIYHGNTSGLSKDWLKRLGAATTILEEEGG